MDGMGQFRKKTYINSITPHNEVSANRLGKRVYFKGSLAILLIPGPNKSLAIKAIHECQKRAVINRHSSKFVVLENMNLCSMLNLPTKTS